jgi:exodeoxyribonuclease V alpha subunit
MSTLGGLIVTTITATLDRFLFQKDDFLIAYAELDMASLDVEEIPEEPFGGVRVTGWAVVKGQHFEPVEGLTYTFHGEWTEHPKYGVQFDFETYETEAPKTSAGICIYLKENAKWLGEQRVEALVAAFGANTLHVCKTEPETVAAHIPGITPERAQEIQKCLLDNEASEKALIAVADILEGIKGVSKAMKSRMVRVYGAKTPELLKTDPYQMIRRIRGFNFELADKIGAAVGIPRTAPCRVKAGTYYTLDRAARFEGHTCRPASKFAREVGQVLGLFSRMVKPVLETMLEAGELVEDDGHIYDPLVYADELKIATKLAELLQNPPQADFEVTSNTLADDQKVAVKAAISSRVFILTGAPGTGKTFTVRYLLDQPMCRGKEVLLVAPTGKAARRLTELTGEPAHTIHRALQPTSVTTDDVTGVSTWSFEYNESNPLPHSTVIVDEVSMVDTSLMARLCEALRNDVRLILVGDIYQLPSVGSGSVLRDMIHSGEVPSVELTEIKRQDAGLIIRNCHRIKDGTDILLPRDGEESDFAFVELEDPDEIQDLIVELVTSVLPADFRADPLRDIQVITALRERSELSCKALNERLQEHFTGERQHEVVQFNPGDKVIQTRNDYAAQLINGDIGFVFDVDYKEQTLDARFDNPDREVTVDAVSNNLQLAYAITGHKFQGSENRIIVIPIHPCLGPMITQRNWLYTAVSRAQEMCVLVGVREEIVDIIDRNKQVRRVTGLQRHLERMLA